MGNSKPCANTWLHFTCETFVERLHGDAKTHVTFFLHGPLSPYVRSELIIVARDDGRAHWSFFSLSTYRISVDKTDCIARARLIAFNSIIGSRDSSRLIR